MLFALKELGKTIIKDVGGERLKLLPFFVKTERYENTKEKPFIIGVYFRLCKGSVEFKVIGEADPKKVREYLWIGNAPGNNPQDRLTTDVLRYIISQTIPNLCKKLPSGSKLASKLEKIKETFFRLGKDIGLTNEKEGSKYLLDPEKIKLGIRLSIGSDGLKSINAYTNEIKKAFEEECGIKIPSHSLFTVFCEDEPLVKSEEYQQYLCDFFFKEPFQERKGKDVMVKEGRCHICNTEGIVTREYTATRFLFSYYIIDKLGFASGFTKEGFFKNFSLCEDCFAALLVGEKFVFNYLRSSLGGYDFCVIPSFQSAFPLGIEDLKKLGKYIKHRFKAIDTIEGYQSFLNQLDEYREEENKGEVYTINLLFYKQLPARSEFKVLKLIEDVPPYRLRIINRTINEVQSKAVNLLGESKDWYVGFSPMGELLSIRRQGNPVHYKAVLDFYEALLHNDVVEYKPLLKRFVETFKHNAFKPSYSEESLVHLILQSNLLLRILGNLQLLKGGDFTKMKIEDLGLPDNIKAYLREIGLDERRGALFLLGYLVGEIGYQQYLRGSPKKPILDKITYQGMGLTKLIRLCSDVFDKLRQYKILDAEHEQIHGIMKKLFDRNISQWGLADYENVYWVISGYAFSTQEKLKGPNKNLNENNKKEEDV